MKILKCIKVAIIICSSSSLLEAQTYDILPLDRSTGLSGNSITSFTQDSLGFIWIGTKNGLNRYNGNTVEVFNSENSRLKSEDIRDLFITTAKLFYISTSDGGLYRFNYEMEEFEDLGFDRILSDQSGSVNEIFETSSGRLLLATSAGLIEWIDDQYFMINLNEEAVDDPLNVQDIHEDDNNRIWLASFGNGLLRLEDNSLLRINSTDEIAPNHILSLTSDNDNRLWLGCQGGGLVSYEIGSNSMSDKNHLINRKSDIVRRVFFDSGQLWILTEGDGLYYINEKREIINFSKSSSPPISGQSVTDIFTDNQENTWVGTAWNGVNVISTPTYSAEPFNINNQPVLSIYLSEDLSLLGTDGAGLKLLEKGNIISSPFPNMTKYVQFIEPSNSNSYWLGTFANGLLEYNRKDGIIRQFVQGDKRNALSFNDVRDIIEMSDGDLWIATWGGGLNYYSSAKDSTHVILKSNNVLDLEFGKEGEVYVATFGDGLFVFGVNNGPPRRVNVNLKDALSAKYSNLLVIHADDTGMIWIGTWEDGLIRYDPSEGNFRYFENEEVLNRKSFVSIEEDRSGNLWFGTKNGILKFDRSSEKFQPFAELEGEFHIKSSFSDQVGTLYFGSTAGLISFDPERIRVKEELVNVVFTDFKLFGESVKLDQGIVSRPITVADSIFLKYDQNIFTLEFNGLEFPQNDDLTYQIKLDGFEKDWRSVGDQNQATYTNLAPGDYQFQVRAFRDMALVGNASINVFVARPVWATWWALTLYVLGIFAIILVAMKLSASWQRMKTNLKIEKITHEKDLELHETKQRFFVNISHEIRTPVTVILGAIKSILDERHLLFRFKNSLDVIRKNGDYLHQLVNELLDYRKLEADQVKLSIQEVDLSEFLEEVFLAFTTKAEENNISYTLKNSTDGEKVWFDPFQIEKALFNLLSNAFKYVSEGDSIALVLESDDQHIFMKVVDSGKGIPAELQEKVFDRFYQSEDKDIREIGFGIGLSIVKDIIQLHQGEVGLISELGVGSTFSIKLPKGDFHFRDGESMPSPDVVDHKSDDLTESPESPDQSHTVLLVEDNEQIRNYLKRILENRYSILEAADGLDGFDVAVCELPDLIISDVLMPGRNGIELTKKLREDRRTSHIPIILLTARTGLVFKKEGFDIGADDYISKPFNDQLLIARVRNLINSRKLLWEKYKLDIFSKPPDVRGEDPDDQFISSLRDIINNNILENDLNPEFLAKELGMSHSVIYKKLKQLTGLSIVEYVREFKLNLAAELLRKYKYSVQEACLKSGFTDRRYFSRSFKAKFGKNPSDFGNH